jgi:Amt family ammonium transporter
MRCMAAKILVIALWLAALAGSALAQEATPPVEPAAAIPDPGNTAWMMVSSILVLTMIVPGLALFYGGLVRAKNMLSILMQCLMITAVVMIIWVCYGYTMSFGDGGNAIISGFGKMFLAGVTTESTAATFSEEVIPEYAFIAFQMTFACITPALIIGGLAERMKFSAVILFVVLWVTFVYFPIAHMVWAGNGFLFNLGALDFAGGTVVHINSGVAALVGALILGKRAGYPREMMAPNSLPLTMVGASLLWVGWFGFNAGSNLEANGGTTLALINTFVATAGAIVGWSVVETLHRGKASMLGGASGVIAGLVAVTPACGTIGPVGAIVLGAIASAGCYVFVALVKPAMRYDDSLDVFGIHGIGGIIGALATGVLSAPLFGGVMGEDFSIASQVGIQLIAVSVTTAWCGIVSAVLYKLVDMTIGLRATPEAEQLGLDLYSHGEVAYHT